MTVAPPPEDDLDRRPIRVRSSGWAGAISGALVRVGASPNGISVAGLIAACGASAAFALTTERPGIATWLFVIGAVLVQVRLLCNLFDGMVAVATNATSPVGELYNEVPDRLSDAVILIGLGYAAGGMVVLGYIAALVAVFVAYVRTIARNAGAPSDFCGPLAKQQRMAVVTIAALLTALFGELVIAGVALPTVALLIVAAGGLLTAVRRLQRASTALRDTGS